jgi:hypothetical protein
MVINNWDSQKVADFFTCGTYISFLRTLMHEIAQLAFVHKKLIIDCN